jgi:hypothetical protein
VKFSIAFAFEKPPKYQTPQPAATSKRINQLFLLERLPMARDIRLPSSANTQSGCDPNQSSGHKSLCHRFLPPITCKMCAILPGSVGGQNAAYQSTTRWVTSHFQRLSWPVSWRWLGKLDKLSCGRRAHYQHSDRFRTSSGLLPKCRVADSVVGPTLRK